MRAVAFGARNDGRALLATASDDRTVRLWDPDTGDYLNTLSGHRGAVWGVAFGARNEGQALLATASNDATVRLWDPDTGNYLERIPTLSAANAVALRVDGVLAVGTARHVLILDVSSVARLGRRVDDATHPNPTTST